MPLRFEAAILSRYWADTNAVVAQKMRKVFISWNKEA
jgi:hypothetical protein